MKQSLKILFALAMAAVTVWGYSIPPAQIFPQEDLARILFWHLPCAICTCWFVFLAPYLSLRYLMDKQDHWDARSVVCNELGFIFALLTMATGIIFSKVQWGAWWSWDPRQTSFLFVLLIYGGYFALRNSFADERKRASNAAAYSLASTLPVLFLIFVLPRVLFSLHPSNTLVEGGLKGDYGNVFIAALVLFTVLSVWLYRLGVRAGLLELASENMNGNLEVNSGCAAPTGVVRPVPVSRES